MAELKIKRYVLRNDVDIALVNYRTELPLRLQRIVGDPIMGEVRQINYYAPEPAYDPLKAPEEQDLVIREDIQYFRDDSPLLLVTNRMMMISYYDEDGKVGRQRPWPKSYTPREAMNEGKRRRENILSDLEARVGFWLLATGQSVDLGRDFVAKVGAEVIAYKQAQSKTLITRIQGDTEDTWLDTVVDPGTGPTTIRQVMIDTLNVWDPS